MTALRLRTRKEPPFGFPRASKQKHIEHSLAHGNVTPRSLRLTVGIENLPRNEVNVFDPNTEDLIRPHSRVLNDDQDVVQRLFANGHQLCFRSQDQELADVLVQARA
jgi:hypothetical protein